MHFDWTIGIGNVISIVLFFPAVVAALAKLVRWADRLDTLMREFPPHRHVGSDPTTDPHIIYPKGMRP